jgi:molecular chaperone DnaJ
LATKRDFYEVLEVPKNASDDEIKKAYRKMAMKYHPDRNPDDKTSEEKFKEAKEAYEALSDPQKKVAYDQYGHAGIDPSMGGFGGAGAQGFGGFADAFGDIFGDIFGAGGARGGRGGPQVFKGGDLRYSMEISLEEAAKGHETQIRIPGWTSCDLCTGTGAESGSKVDNPSAQYGHSLLTLSIGILVIFPVPLVYVTAEFSNRSFVLSLYVSFNFTNISFTGSTKTPDQSFLIICL